jgi:hypothetical protein
MTLVEHLAGRGGVSAAVLRSEMGLSRATLSRIVARAGPVVLRLGRTRATHYAKRPEIAGLAPRVPVSEWPRGLELARDFWDRVSRDTLISEPLCTLAMHHAK